MVYVKTEYYVIPEGYFHKIDTESLIWEKGYSGQSFGPFSTYAAAEQGLAALMRSGRFLGAKIETRHADIS